MAGFDEINHLLLRKGYELVSVEQIAPEMEKISYGDGWRGRHHTLMVGDARFTIDIQTFDGGLLRFESFHDFAQDRITFRSAIRPKLKFHVDRIDFEREADILFTIGKAAADQLPICAGYVVNATQSTLITTPEIETMQNPDWGMF